MNGFADGLLLVTASVIMRFQRRLPATNIPHIVGPPETNS
jgi:hypothetical protein